MTNKVAQVFSNLGHRIRSLFKRSPKPSNTEPSAEPSAEQDPDAGKNKTTKLVNKIAINFLYYFPQQLGFVMEYVLLFISNQPYLVTSAGLSNTLVETLLIVPVFSLNLGLATLVSQAVGATQYGVAGFYLLRSILINLLVFTTCSLLLSSSKKVMGWMGSSELVIEQAVIYVTYGFISSVLACIFDLMRNFIQAHQIFRIPALVQCCCTLGLILLEFIVVKLFGCGLVGLGVCKIIGELSKSIILVWYVRRAPKLRQSIVSFRRDYFHCKVLWIQMKKQSFAGSLFFLDWFGFLLMCFVVSGLQSTDVSSFFVSFTIITLFTSFADSISAPLGVMIGHAAGGGNVDKVRRLIKVGVIWGVVVSVIMSMVMSLVRGPLPWMFTTKEDVAAKASNILYSFCWVFPFYMGQNIMVAIFRSLGKERTASYLLFLSIYVIGIPCSALLGYPLKLGVYGVRYGYAIGILANVVLFMRLFWKIKLEDQVTYISDQLRQDDKNNHELIEQARVREEATAALQEKKNNDQENPANGAPGNLVQIVGINLEEDPKNEAAKANIVKEFDHNADRISDIYLDDAGETPNDQELSSDIEIKGIDLTETSKNEDLKNPLEKHSPALPTDIDSTKSLVSNSERGASPQNAVPMKIPEQQQQHLRPGSTKYAGKNVEKKDLEKSGTEALPELETKAERTKTKKYTTLVEDRPADDANTSDIKN